MRVLVTGATGFIGRELLGRLAADGHALSAAVRDPASQLPEGVRSIAVGDIGPKTDWSGALDGVEAVVHLAARVHVLKDQAKAPLVEFRKVNAQGTVNLARAAAEAGVRRFVFMSTIKVNGENTTPGKPFLPDQSPAPLDPYGISKLEAENGLASIAGERGMEATIIRPTMVYGPGVKGNFLSLIKLVDRGVPLPFGVVRNSRSLTALGNLVDLISVCLIRPEAANQVFLAGDGADISTAELLRAVGMALGHPAILIPVPTVPMAAIAKAVGMKAFVTRLLDNLQVDIGKNARILGWRPPVSLKAELERVVAWYRESSRKG
jgi:nucleoside-diphosphate-sugar epimerase